MCTGINVSINDNKYSLQTGSVDGSLLRAFSDYTGTGNGIYKTLGLGQKVFEAGVHLSSFISLAPDRVKDCTFLSSWIAGARSLLIVTKLTSLTVKEFFEKGYKWLTDATTLGSLIYAVVDLTNDLVCFLGLFRIPEAGKLLLKKVGSVFLFIQATWDLKRSWDEYNLCSALQDRAENLKNLGDREKLLTYIKERKRYLMLNMAADILDYAVSIILFSGFMFGVATLPVLAFWGIGATACFIKYSAEIYEKSMTFMLKDEGKVEASIA